jgi:hypothetical protein
MTNTIFSTVDRLTSRLKPIDSLINHVAARLLPQHEAKADGPCPSGWTWVGTKCYYYCNITSDLHMQRVNICYCPDCNGPLYSHECCDCCD